MSVDDFGALHILRESLDTAVGTVERGKVAAYVQALDGQHKARAWTVGDTVKGVFLTSGTDGQQVRVASPGSTTPVANGLLPAESVLPGDRLAVLGTGAFGPADPANDLPEAATAVGPADEFSDSIQATLDANMTTGAGMSTITNYMFGDTNQTNLGTNEGTIWTGYNTTAFSLPRLAAAAALFVSSSDSGDAGVIARVRGIKGGGAAIPFEEFAVDVLLDAVDAQVQVPLTGGTLPPGETGPAPAGLTGAEAPLCINSLSVANDGGPSLVTLLSFGGGPNGTVYVGPTGAVAGKPATVLHEVAVLNGKSRGASQIAVYAVPAGFQAASFSSFLQSGFQDSFSHLLVKIPGVFEAQSIRLHTDTLSAVNFFPPITIGSVTKGAIRYPPGTQFEIRAQTTVGTGEASASVGIDLEVIPS